MTETEVLSGAGSGEAYEAALETAKTKGTYGDFSHYEAADPSRFGGGKGTQGSPYLIKNAEQLQYLAWSGERKTMREALDFTGLSHAAAILSLQKLVLKKLARYSLNTEELYLNAELTEQADEVLQRIRESEEDYLRLRYGITSEEEKDRFREAEETQVSALRKRLE